MSLEDKKTLMGIAPPTKEQQEQAKREIEESERQAASAQPVSGREAINPPTALDKDVIEVKKNVAGVFHITTGPKRDEHTQKGTFKMPTVPTVVINDAPPLPKTHAQMVPPAPMTVTDKGTVRLGTMPRSAWAADAEEKRALEKQTTVQIAAAKGLLPSSLMAPYRPEEAHESMRKSPDAVQQLTGKRALAIVASVAALVAVAGTVAIRMSGKDKGSSNEPAAVTATATPTIPEQTKPEPTSIPTAAPVAEPTSEPAAINSGSPIADAGVPTRASKSSAPLAPKRTVPSSRPQPIPVPAEPKKPGNNSVIDPWAK